MPPRMIPGGIGNILKASDPAGARTQDPILKRDVLYLLSYRIDLSAEPCDLRDSDGKDITLLSFCQTKALFSPRHACEHDNTSRQAITQPKLIERAGRSLQGH